MEKLYTRLLKQHCTLSNMIVLLLLNLIMAFIILPEAATSIITGTKTIKIIEYSFFYSPIEFYQIINNYGAIGRSNYSFILLTADLFFAILYVLLLSFLAYTMTQRLPFQVKFKFYLLPPFFIILELIENSCLLFLLYSFPLKYLFWAKLLSLITTAKWIILISFCSLLFVGLIIILYRQRGKLLKI